MRSATHGMRRFASLAIVLGVALTGLAVGVFASQAASPSLLSGSGGDSSQYPDWIDTDTGLVIYDRLPEYLPAWNRAATAIAGVVHRDYMFPPLTEVAEGVFTGPPPSNDPWPVLDSEGGHLVGYILPGIGFVSLAEQKAGFMPEQVTATTAVGAPEG
mgnify:CR=1 FL=1